MAGCSSLRSGAKSDSLKPRIAEPRPRPASGSRLGPSTISATARIRSRCVGLRMFSIICGPCRSGQSARCAGMATTRDLLQRPLVDALISRPTDAARRTTPPSRHSLLTLSGVRSLGERRDAGEELWRLPLEQPHGGQELRGAYGSAFRLAGPADRADWELPVEELRRLGHDP